MGRGEAKEGCSKNEGRTKKDFATNFNNDNNKTDRKSITAQASGGASPHG
jgi:hypothetical protein